MTALDEIPPLGLPQKIFVEFTEGSQRTFFAETCTFVLRVPTVHKEFREFKEKFLEASQNLQDLPASESSVFICYQV